MKKKIALTQLHITSFVTDTARKQVIGGRGTSVNGCATPTCTEQGPSCSACQICT